MSLLFEINFRVDDWCWRPLYLDVCTDTMKLRGRSISWLCFCVEVVTERALANNEDTV